ncbi:MAG: hypothetical protein EA353_04430 [Puniceicoccaceae bacterium]|nr:MAG: hypothetical protein EA353_04430 [Puniceicoccaceae bacterium]
MSFLTHSPQRERFLLLLWGLLFTKCFIVEFYVQSYQPPVNSWLYVWALSISMATVATLVSLRLRAREARPVRLQPGLLRIWGACLAIALIGVLVFLLFPALALEQVTLWLSLSLAGGYAVQSLHTANWIDRSAALGWCLILVVLLFVAATQALLVFGLGILAFCVLPLAMTMVLDWMEAREALPALQV